MDTSVWNIENSLNTTNWSKSMRRWNPRIFGLWERFYFYFSHYFALFRWNIRIIKKLFFTLFHEFYHHRIIQNTLFLILAFDNLLLLSVFLNFSGFLNSLRNKLLNFHQISNRFKFFLIFRILVLNNNQRVFFDKFLITIQFIENNLRKLTYFISLNLILRVLRKG